MEGDEESVS
jgi:hypothetical protein